jgi:hypothetical protein
MLYDVEQVASQLNVSKQTIYSKLKLKEYKGKVLIKQGKSYVDDDLFNLIKDTLKVKSSFNTTVNVDTPVEPKNVDNTIVDEDLLNLNKDLINALLEQLKEKDIQIHELHKLIENNQVLLKEKPQQDLLQLEEHFYTLDNKLIEIRNQLEQRKAHQDSQNIFKKIFKK